MGVALWLLSGIAAFALSRAIHTAKPSKYTGELSVALPAAFLAGLTATALDFGGWRELDGRAALFVFLCVLAIIAVVRLVVMMTSRTVAR